MVAQKLSEKSRNRSTFGEVIVIGGSCASCEVKLVRELKDDLPLPPEPESDDDDDLQPLEEEDDYGNAAPATSRPEGIVEQHDSEQDREASTQGKAATADSSTKKMTKGKASKASKGKGGRKRRTSLTKYVDGEKVTTVLKSKPKPPPSPNVGSTAAEVDEGGDPAWSAADPEAAASAVKSNVGSAGSSESSSSRSPSSASERRKRSSPPASASSGSASKSASKMKKASGKGKGKRRTSITRYQDGQKVTIELKAKPKPPPG